MNEIDHISLLRTGVVIYMAVFIAVAFWMVTFVKKSGKRYVVCGKSLNLFFVCIMLMTQAIDANATMGASSNAYLSGLWTGFTFPLGLAGCLVVVGLFFAKPLNSLNLLTLPDFYQRRYSSAVESVVSVIMGFSFMILVAGNLAGGGWILGYVFGLNYTTALLIITVIVFGCTITGGLFSCAATDAVQICAAKTGFIMAAVWLLYTYGWDSFAAALPDTLGAPENYYNLTGLTRIDNGAMINYAGIMALVLGDVIALDFMERIFAAKSARTARLGCFYAAFLTIFVGLSSCLIGLAAYSLIPDLASSDPRMIMPEMAANALPLGFGVLVIAGILGAGASTASGGLLGVSTVVGRNLYQKNIYRLYLKSKGTSLEEFNNEENRAKFDKRLLLIARIAAIPVMLCAMYIAHVRPEPGVLLVLAFDVAFAGCLVPLILGLSWKKANSAGAMAGVIAGSLVRLILYLWITNADDLGGFARWVGVETLISPTVSFIVMWFVTLATQEAYPPKWEAIQRIPSDSEVLAGLA